MGKEKPPISDQIIDFAYPGTDSFALDNGLTVQVVHQPVLPKVFFRLGFRFGDKLVPRELAGAGDLLASTLKKGTAHRGYEEIVEGIERLGGELDAASSPDFFFVAGEFLAHTLEEGLRLVREVVEEPVFPEEEVAKERQIQLAELHNQKSSPAYLASRRLYKMVFGTHPYAVFKDESSLARIQRTHLSGLHAQYFRPEDAVLMVGGDLAPKEAHGLAVQLFGAWKASKQRAQRPTLPSLDSTQPRRIHLIHRPQAAQSTLYLGIRLFARNHPDYEKMLVTNKILGGGASGRLFMNLREEKGYTYGAYSQLQLHQEAGFWLAHADVRPEVTAAALETFQEEILRIGTEPVETEELRTAQRYLMGIFPLQNETASSVARLALEQIFYGLPEDYWRHYLERIAQVSIEDVLQTASRYLRTEHLQIAVVGDADKILAQLQALGPVQVFDVNDHPIQA
ncbi:MAG: insulinase family protein [Calditrichaeota bacterium]|nr:MAG: insulinase family protein [Calditrichota bacterium]